MCLEFFLKMAQLFRVLLVFLHELSIGEKLYNFCCKKSEWGRTLLSIFIIRDEKYYYTFIVISTPFIFIHYYDKKEEHQEEWMK